MEKDLLELKDILYLVYSAGYEAANSESKKDLDAAFQQWYDALPKSS